MNYILLKEYIKKITKYNIIDYAKKNDIYLNKEEVDILLYYIKNKYLDFIKDPDTIIKELKEKLTTNTYNKLVIIYNQNKDKIRTYFPQ